MCRSSAATGLIVEASRMLHERVGVLSSLECGAAMRTLVTDARRVFSLPTRVASSWSDFVIFPSMFVDETKSTIIYGIHELRHTKLRSNLERYIHITPAPSSEVSHNPRWVGS